MLRKFLAGTALVLVTLGARSLPGAEQLSPPAAWTPQGAVLTAEITDTKPLFDLLLADKTIATITASPDFKKATDTQEFKQLKGAVAYLEATLDTDWKTALRKLVGSATFTAYPQEGVLITVDARDAKLLNQLHEILVQFAKGEADKANDPTRVKSNEYRGLTAWTFNKDEAHVIVGNRLLLANKPALLKAALDLRAKENDKCLAATPTYQAARQAVAADSVLLAQVDMAMLKQHPPIKKVLAGGDNPLAALLFAGLTEALQDSTWFALGARIEGPTFSLTMATDGKPGESSTAAFAFPNKPGEGALANLSVPRTIAAMSFHRDLHSFYANKDKLFPDRTSGLIFFENMMGIFFTGRDLTDEVLAETKPEVRIVVAEQQYDAKTGTPRIQIPAFAAIFRLKNPDKFREVAEEAWQKALGLINFTRGQKAQPGLILDRPIHNGVQFTVSRFPLPKESERQNLDVQYNFRPSLAMLGEYLVLSSTEGLARDLIDTLKDEMAQPVKPLAGAHSLIELQGGQLASILVANRDNLVRQNILEKGHSEEEAERDTDLLLTIVKLVGQVKLDLGTHEGQTRVNLNVSFKL